MLGRFEASLMQMLIDKFGVGPEDVGRLLSTPRAHPGDLVSAAVGMKLVDGRRLCQLLCQYWERPFFDLSFPYRRFLMYAHRPIGPLVRLGLLPLTFGDDAVTVVGCYVPEDEVLGDLSAQLGKPVLLLLAEAERVAEGLRLLDERMRRLAEASPGVPEGEGDRGESERSDRSRRECAVIDCGSDKRRFIELAESGWPVLLHESFAGGSVRVEYDRAGTLTKTLEALDPSEPKQLVSYLVGKAMVHQVTPEEDVGTLVNSFVQSIPHFQGELKDAILRLRMASMLLEEQES